MDSVKRIEQELAHKNVLLSHIGILDPDIMTRLFMQTEEILHHQNSRFAIVKRVYNLVVEAVQNVYHHSAKAEHSSPPCFYLACADNNYEVITGNAIFVHQLTKVEDKINKVNQLDRESLTTLYRETLDNGIVSEKGGSGLGFIEMKRRSRNNLEYKFLTLDKEVAYFLLKITV